MVKVSDSDSFYRQTGVSRETMVHIRRYHDLVVKWQKKINLVSNASLSDIWCRHFYDSFQLNSLFGQSIGGNLQILDIGSGAGFPGLLLSMLGSGEFHMVESNAKKCTFMNQVIRETTCRAVVHCARMEDLAVFPIDYIISRACAPVGRLIEIAQGFIHPETICLFLKGQNADKEIAAARQKWQFKLEKFTSLSEASGVIVKVSDIKALNESV
ncbi:MAG: 16S rRNA (guanine(527)-N(7))-methyltransferase RsmG [Alphaproteobacteria bacterium]|nr:16S rRNA (guanine(527)-N(7))-methyltransferase RsmG [Alphaproteobacteria bacterium]